MYVVRGALAVGLVVAVVASSCGGDDKSTGALDAGPQAATAAADVLVARWEDEGAFFVVMAAFDAGYDAGQVIVNAANLRADGTIAGESPSGPALGMLSPLAAGITRPAAVPPESPRDQYISFIDSTLGEVYFAGLGVLGRASIREQVDVQIQDRVVDLILMLAGVGYHPEQIVEALIFDTVSIRIGPINQIRCWVIEDGDRVITPHGPAEWDVDILCPEIYSTTTTTNSVTTDSASADPPTDDIPGGRYLGSVTTTDAFADAGFEVTTSETEFVIDQGSVEVVISYTMRYHHRYINESPSCTATIQDIWIGSGTFDGSAIMAELSPTTRDIIELVGDDCNVAYSDGTARDSIMAEFAEEGSALFEGSLSGKTITGVFAQFLDVVATR